jgi:hypothetical protein
VTVGSHAEDKGSTVWDIVACDICGGVLSLDDGAFQGDTPTQETHLDPEYVATFPEYEDATL